LGRDADDLPGGRRSIRNHYLPGGSSLYPGTGVRSNGATSMDTGFTNDKTGSCDDDQTFHSTPPFRPETVTTSAMGLVTNRSATEGALHSTPAAVTETREEAKWRGTTRHVGVGEKQERSSLKAYCWDGDLSGVAWARGWKCRQARSQKSGDALCAPINRNDEWQGCGPFSPRRSSTCTERTCLWCFIMVSGLVRSIPAN
jgi:hypothetical protein